MSDTNDIGLARLPAAAAAGRLAREFKNGNKQSVLLQIGAMRPTRAVAVAAYLVDFLHDDVYDRGCILRLLASLSEDM